MGKKLGFFNDVTSIGDTYHVPLIKKNTDNYNILPSDFAKSQSHWHSITTGITAFATGGQASATQLVSEYNKVTVVGTNADSVKALDAVAGTRMVVVNADAAQTLAIFPKTGELFEGLAANASVSLVAGLSVEFICFVTGTWTEI